MAVHIRVVKKHDPECEKVQHGFVSKLASSVLCRDDFPYKSANCMWKRSAAMVRHGDRIKATSAWALCLESRGRRKHS